MSGGATATGPPRWCVSDLGRRAWEVGATAAGPAATAVDREARFPFEAVAAMREAGLLGAMVPVDHGGEGASLADVCGAVRAIAAHCASSALVLAMHQIEVAYVSRHGGTPALSALLGDVATGSVLMANANSEVGLGGDVGQSRCAVVHDNGRVHLEKEVLALSYGEYADVITVIARRHPEAGPSDQVMLVCGPGTFSLEATSTWDTMGLRGTCSAGYLLVADEADDMILPDPWEVVANRTGLPSTTILLNSVWLGIAESAASLAHASVRREARRTIGTTPPSALRLAELVVVLGQARSVMTTTIAAAEAVGDETIEAHSVFVLEMSDLKLSITTLAADVVLKALAICGLGGYRRDSSNSVERQVRDVLGGQLMANNNRFYVDNARLLTILKQL